MATWAEADKMEMVAGQWGLSEEEFQQMKQYRAGDQTCREYDSLSDAVRAALQDLRNTE